MEKDDVFLSLEVAHADTLHLHSSPWFCLATEQQLHHRPVTITGSYDESSGSVLQVPRGPRVI
jgi:hypothetical protein